MAGEIPPPPSPPGERPLLGHAPEFAGDPLGSLERWVRDHGDVVGLRLAGTPGVIVARPDLISEVLDRQADRFTVSRTARDAFAPIEESALVVSRGDAWKRQRRLLQRHFAPRSVEPLRRAILEETDRWIGERRPGEELDVYDGMSTLTIRIVSRCFLGYDVAEREDPMKEGADAVVGRADATSFQSALPRWVPSPANLRILRARRRLHRFIDEILADPEGGEGSLRARLREALDEGLLNREEVRDNVVSLFLAGSDTSSAGLTHTLHFLGTHPAEEDALRQAVRSRGPAGDPDPDELGDVPEASHAVKEGLRLRPPAFATGRSALVDAEVGGYAVPRGAEVVMPQWVVHRDERYYAEPESFRPSRWAEGPGLPRYAYFPFGGGQRFCLGSHFAMLEMPLILARFLQRVDGELLTDSVGGLTPSVTLRPRARIRMRIRAVHPLAGQAKR